jgi:hypothetical protein
MKVTLISDTHTKHKQLNGDLQGGDLLIHAGDFTMHGSLKEIDEFNKAVSEGRLYEWLEELVSSNPEKFVSSFRKTPSAPLSPEEQAKKDKAAEKSREQYKTQVQKLEQEFTNINNKIKDSVSTESEVLSKVKSFAK